MKRIAAAILLSLILVVPLGAREVTILGDYVEARTSDVFTGPCYANSEVNLVGKEAVMAWRVREGEWQGVPLAGLSVVAIVKARATLGDPHAEPLPARSVIVVDERATPQQKGALVDFSRFVGEGLLDEVVAVETAAIDVEIGEGHGLASVKAGELAAVATRSLHEGDKICGNEEIYYPPLTELRHAHPGYTLVHEFNGDGLGTNWKSPGKRSAFVGEFAY